MTENQPSPRDRDFIVALESVRGLAALSVALFHAFHFLPVDGVRAYDKTLWNVPSVDALLMRLIMVPFNGGAAVSLFFVLSGFVLALSLQRGDQPPAAKAWGFFTRRFLRIYPPLAINIGLFAAVVALIAAFIPVIQIPTFTQGQIVANLLLRDFPINGPTWSLLVELAAIPFLFLGYCVARRWGIRGLAVLAALGVVTLFSPTLAFRTLIGNFVFMFFLGMLVAEVWVRKLFSLDARTARVWLIAAVVAMLNARFVLGYGSKWSLLVEGLASAALIAALVLGPRLRVHGVLEMEFLRFLGRISYSYYLYHPLVLTVLLAILMISPAWMYEHPFAASALIAVVTAIVTIPLGYGSYVLTERPMMRLGRRH